jgi:magnesium transporter
MIEQSQIDLSELREAWWILSAEDRLEGFRLLGAAEAEDFFLDLDARDQMELLLVLPAGERRLWMHLLPPDDAADLIQEAEPDERPELVGLLDAATRRDVTALLAYAEDAAGGLMSSRYARVRPDMTADQAIAYLRKQALSAIEPETIYYVYVLDSAQKLLGVISFRDLFAAAGTKTVREVMTTDVVAAPEEMDQEALARLFAEHDLLAVPVVDANGILKGIVTVDDIVDVVEEEATEDIHKYGGLEALEEPYLRTGFGSLFRKRAGWLTLLFMGEMLTTVALSRYEERIAAASFLALFIPLIISSGGNSGSQASTLVIRAMTVGEVRLRDWWRVARREMAAGLSLGLLLGTLGMLRVLGAPVFGGDFGTEPLMVGFAVSLSLVGVVIFGTMAGSMLPFVLRRVGLDPASASAPLVATMVDVTGLLIYFSLATLLLKDILT